MKNVREKQKKKKSGFDIKTAKRVLRLIRSSRWVLIASLLCAAVSALLSLAVPLLVGDAIDEMLGPNAVNLPRVTGICIAIGVSALVTALTQWGMNVLNNRMAYHLVYRLRREAFEKLQRLPLSYLDSRSTGGLLSRMVNDVDQFTDGLLLGFNQFFTGILTILGTLIIMLTVKPSVALVVIFITPLSLFVASFIASRTYSMFKLQSETRAEQTAMIDEYIGNHKVVTAFGYEDESQEIFDEINERLRKCSLRATFFSSITNPSTRFVNNLVYAGVALLGSLLCLPSFGASFTVGRLTGFLSYANKYTKPFNEISDVFAEFQNSLACAARLFELLDEETVPPDAPGARVLDHADGRVELCDVAFSYSPDRELIRDLNLAVRPGERVAIVGPTGCGKTTVINLLMRFYDIDSGSILVDGRNISDITRKSLRLSYSMVLQDTWLFYGTIYENIAYGRPDATREEVIAAAKAARIHTYIESLPQGYDTLLIDDGTNISKGQKQLLTIARALLMQTPMLILDEATSNVDTRTEHQIQAAMRALMADKTCFVVAHRLSTIRNADCILVVRDGNVVERGTHEELMRQKGFYYEMHQAQYR